MTQNASLLFQQTFRVVFDIIFIAHAQNVPNPDSATPTFRIRFAPALHTRMRLTDQLDAQEVAGTATRHAQKHRVGCGRTETECDDVTSRISPLVISESQTNDTASTHAELVCYAVCNVTILSIFNSVTDKLMTSLPSTTTNNYYFHYYY